MKKGLFAAALLLTLGLVGCANKEATSSKQPESKPASSSQKAESSKESVVSSTPKSSEAPASSSAAPVAKEHKWVKGNVVKNSDQKDCTNYTCSDAGCDALRVEIAITDASTGADNIESSGKLKKSATIAWKIVAPKAGTATLQFCVKYGQSGSSLTDDVRNTFWGNYQGGPGDYLVNVGETPATVLVNSTITYEESGVTEEGAYINFATVQVAQGENTISLTTPKDQYYRNAFINNVALVFEATK
ncbi:MAG: hypothetical protein MJ217_02810 [Bacilli bacterium]|nr:hypothetical protein [Bacilli bacterium]